MELRLLRYFLTIVREETITRAAEALHITQPTLSRQMAQLEKELGVRIFEQQGRRLLLTSEGHLLRRRAEEILTMVDKMERELTCQTGNLHGTISIGHGEIASMSVLADCLAGFSRRYPYVQYNFFSGPAEVVQEQMDQGLIDIGLLLEPASMEKYEYIRTNVIERYGVFMRPEDPLAAKETIEAEDLDGKPLIIPSRRRSFIISWLGKYYKEENLRYSIMLPNMGAVLVSKGLGYMLVVQDSIPFCDQEKIVMRPLAGDLDRNSLLAWRRGQPANQATEKFIQYAKCFCGMDKET